MANKHIADARVVTTALESLEKLGKDRYVLAFGPDGKQFFATPKGYFATQLPTEVVDLLTSKTVRKITWASYGSHPDSWFFAFEMMDGTSTFEVGASVPAALNDWLHFIRPKQVLLASLRVQLGSNDSFVGWARSYWICYNVPAALHEELRVVSGNCIECLGVTKGLFKVRVKQITWHGDGSYYTRDETGHSWYFESQLTYDAWASLWPGNNPKPSLEVLSDLAFVAFDPHVPVGETFAFLQKKFNAREAPFVMRVYGDMTHRGGAAGAPPAPVQDMSLQHAGPKVEKPKSVRWAICKRSGRPHSKDMWELEVKKNERVKILERKENNWFVAEKQDGKKGWVHGTWLAFCGIKTHKDPRDTYGRFQQDMQKLLVPGQLREFPSLSEHLNTCAIVTCQTLKENSRVDICMHDLQTLLEGSGSYSYEWLKEERLVWHPDRFAKYCHPEHKEELKECAQELFVLYGLLMDECKEEK